MFFKGIIIKKKKFGKALFNEDNPMWKGDSVGYNALHMWIKRRLIKPCICPSCNKKPPIDMHNISGLYKRDLNDWIWLCRSCHVKLHKNLKGVKG